MPQYAIPHVRVFLQYRVKFLYGTAELKGMQQRHGTVECRLRRGVARGDKVYRSELLIVSMLMFLRHTARSHHNQQDATRRLVPITPFLPFF